MQKSIYSADYKKFLQQFKAARIKAGMTQGEVAEGIGETQSFVSKCERGERRVDLVELRSFCEVLEVPFIKFIRDFDQNLGK